MSFPQLLEIACRLVGSASASQCKLRILGGVAFFYHRHGMSFPRALERDPADIDFAAYSHERGALEAVIAREGFLADRNFNAVQAPFRAKYARPGDQVEVEIFFDQMIMCHQLDFRGRLELAPVTIPLVDLALSKLQIIRWARKDTQDFLGLLLNHHTATNSDQAEIIDLVRIAGIVGKDWGWYRTAMGSLEHLHSVLAEFITNEEQQTTISASLRSLQNVILQAPKSLRWHLRAAIGERVPWFDTPE